MELHITKLVTEPRTPPLGFNCPPRSTRTTVVPIYDKASATGHSFLHVFSTLSMQLTATRIMYGWPLLPRCLCRSSARQRAFVFSAFWFLVIQRKNLGHSSLHLGAQTTAGSWSFTVETLYDSLTDENKDTLNSFNCVFASIRYLLSLLYLYVRQ